jgi:hypothetical protein
MRNLLTIIVMWCLFVTVAYAGKYDDLAVYFPMTPGTVWTYQIPGKAPEWQVRVLDCGTGADGVRECSIESLISPNLPPIYNIFVIQGDAVLNRASKSFDLLSGEMEEWKRHTPSRIVLQSPLKPGTKWETVLNADLKKERFKVISIGKESVKAGAYENVIKLKREIFNKEKKTRKWKQCGDCNVFEYYAPNVGLIKEEMIEKNKVEIFRELVDVNTPVEKGTK